MFSTFGFFDVFNDPGPCIICGAPHTTCTPESVAAQRKVAATVTAPVDPAPVAEPDTFTTTNYDGQLKPGRRPGGRK